MHMEPLLALASVASENENPVSNQSNAAAAAAAAVSTRAHTSSNNAAVAALRQNWWQSIVSFAVGSSSSSSHSSTSVEDGNVGAIASDVAADPIPLAVDLDSEDMNYSMGMEVTNKRISTGTKSKYKSNLLRMKNWFASDPRFHFMLVFDNGEPKDIKLPVSDDSQTIKALLTFLGHVINTPKNNKYPSLSTVRTMKSALVYSHQVLNTVLPASVNIALENALKGFSRLLAESKQKGEMSVFEGKNQFTMEMYKILSMKLVAVQPRTRVLNSNRSSLANSSSLPAAAAGDQQQDAQDQDRMHVDDFQVNDAAQPIAIGNVQPNARSNTSWRTLQTTATFAWCFIVLQWNLMSRSESVASICLQHLSWQGDCLVILVPKTKTDQSATSIHPRHVYANPYDPEICPILSLAVFVFSHPFRYAGNKNSLFAGSYQNNRFGKILLKMLGNLSESERVVFSSIGEEKTSYGTHSVRKGSASYCTSLKDGPHTVNVFQRAGWSIGNTQDRYLFHGEGSDQFVGRVVSGLPITDVKFACLPPRFHSSVVESVIDWEAVFPGYHTLPGSFRSVLPFLLASLSYHRVWLTQNLHHSHPLLHTPLFAQKLIDPFCGRVIPPESTYGRCDLTGIQATGVPTMLLISTQISHFQKKMENISSNLPENIVTKILDKCHIHGAIPITRDDMAGFQREIMSQMKDIVNQSIRQNTHEHRQPTDINYLLIDDAEVLDASIFRLFVWPSNGEFHMVPENYEIPRVNIKNVFFLWHYGNKEHKIKPLRCLKESDFSSNKEKQQLSRTRKVMQWIEQAGKIKNNTPISDDPSNSIASSSSNIHSLNFKISSLTLSQASVYFDECYNYILDLLYAESNHGRAGHQQINSIYNKALQVELEKKLKKKIDKNNKKRNSSSINNRASEVLERNVQQRIDSLLENQRNREET